MLGNGVRGLTGHEEALEVGGRGPQLLRQLPAVAAGHDDIGYQQAQVAGMLLGEADGLRGSLRLQDRVACLARIIAARFIIAGSSSTSRILSRPTGAGAGAASWRVGREPPLCRGR